MMVEKEEAVPAVPERVFVEGRPGGPQAASAPGGPGPWPLTAPTPPLPT